VADKPTVAVQIRGKEFRLRSDDEAESLQRVAGYLDETMATVEKRTGTIDSLDLALLTGLNLAREIVREREGAEARGGASSEQLEALTDLVEAELDTTPAPSA
jgi:cell division protein ZapA (FtsZ GTPase activity inhibitor)